MQLFPIELLRTATKLHAPQLLQQVLEALILRERLVALRDDCVELGAHYHHQPLQGGDVAWQWLRVLAHARTESDSRAVVAR